MIEEEESERIDIIINLLKETNLNINKISIEDQILINKYVITRKNVMNIKSNWISWWDGGEFVFFDPNNEIIESPPSRWSNISQIIELKLKNILNYNKYIKIIKKEICYNVLNIIINYIILIRLFTDEINENKSQFMNYLMILTNSITDKPIIYSSIHEIIEQCVLLSMKIPGIKTINKNCLKIIFIDLLKLIQIPGYLLISLINCWNLCTINPLDTLDTQNINEIIQKLQNYEKIFQKPINSNEKSIKIEKFQRKLYYLILLLLHDNYKELNEHLINEIKDYSNEFLTI